MVDEAERQRQILDAHLPTIISGLQEAVYKDMYVDREDLTPEQLGLRAALSAAHWIAKDIATGGGEPLYDLPSVLDLMKQHRKDAERIAALEARQPVTDAEVEAAIDQALSDDDETIGMLIDWLGTGSSYPSVELQRMDLRAPIRAALEAARKVQP